MQASENASVHTAAVTAADYCAHIESSLRAQKTDPTPINFPNGVLTAISKRDAGDVSLRTLLTDWRNANSECFFSQRAVTLESTDQWLRRLLDQRDRILFLVRTTEQQPIGHIGLTNAINSERDIEIDNVLRGESGSASGEMAGALMALCNWAWNTLQPSTISLRVFSDNERAISFYRKVGFRDDKLIPMMGKPDGTGLTFYEATAEQAKLASRYALRMVLHSHS